MASPIIIDDGGSTRIRLVNAGHVARFPLLNVRILGASSARATQTLRGPYTQIKGISIDHTGEETSVVVGPLIDGDRVTIASDHGHRVTATIGSEGQCKIVVRGPVANPPLIEGKQIDGERSYVVTNAGRILNIAGKANGEEFYFETVPGGTIYNALILS
jgi:hypothetical protein